MKNTRKLKYKKKSRKHNRKYSRKHGKKHSRKQRYFLIGGQEQKKCEKPPNHCTRESCHTKEIQEKDEKCPYGPTEEEKKYCESFDEKTQSKERELCFKELTDSYEVIPGQCNYHTCCGDCNELCYPIKDIWRNGIYVPIKYTWDQTTRTLSGFIGGMFAFSMAGLYTGAIQAGIKAITENLPDIDKVTEKLKKQFNFTNINPAAFANITPGQIPGQIPVPGQIPGQIPVPSS